MPRYGPLTGSAWIDARLNGSQISRRGGPVRLAISSIEKQTTLANMFAAVTKKGWVVEVVGSTWVIFDPALYRGRLVAIVAGMPVFRP